MSRTNILLVASDPQYCQEAQLFFAQYPCDLIVAQDRDRVFNFLNTREIAAIICPIQTSQIEGFALLQQLQAQQKTARIPFIMLGNTFNRREHRQAMEMGADDILFAPYCWLDVESAISVRLRKNYTLLAEPQQELEQLRHSIATFLPHEMRTALTGIIAASELLFRKQDSLEPFIVKEMLNCINLSGKRLSRLIHNFLLYSELRSIASDELKIADLRQDCTRDVKNAISNTVLNYSQKYSRQEDFILDVEDACVQIGSSNFSKLVTELIDNACKFSPGGTPIKITAKIRDNRFILDICDRGRGMTSEQIASIGMGVQFDRLIYEQQGFGLGLAISQDLAKLHGGDLLIDSKLNQATNVSVILPISSYNNCN